MLRVLLLFLFAIPQSGFAQTQIEADPFAAAFISRNIDLNRLQQHLEKIASNEFEGRETGTPGSARAAQYLIQELKNSQVEKAPGHRDYFQQVAFTWIKWENLGVEVNGTEYKHLWDFLSFHDENHNLPYLRIKDVVFLGYGIDDPAYSDYANANVRSKVIMIYPGEPLSPDSISYISGSRDPSEWAGNIQKKLAIAAKHKVRMVLIIDPQIRSNVSVHRNRVLSQSLYFGKVQKPDLPNHIFISTQIAKEIIGEKWNPFLQNQHSLRNTGVGRPLRLPVKMNVQQHISRNVLYDKNVIGYIEGVDSSLKDEVVVLSAHYDHLGRRGNSIFRGADDNASGTTALLEIMRVVAEAKNKNLGPRRSVMAIFFTGEEKGLLGSEYFSENPSIPLENITVNINIDMIGRTDRDHEESPQYIYVIGSNRLSTDLHNINEAVNNHFSHLQLDYTYNAKNDPNRYYYRSDHYNFAKKGIPSIFFFTGTHEDYHRPGDTPDKILYSKYHEITTHIYHLVWEIANRDKRIRVDVVDDTVYDR
ncbi:MAG: M28 family peptidase [Saprospiraceae bacterium]|nr:M28 family peptidase [Saprospiraceae bacterium]